jgi:hypothetical protein
MDFLNDAACKPNPRNLSSQEPHDLEYSFILHGHRRASLRPLEGDMSFEGLHSDVNSLVNVVMLLVTGKSTSNNTLFVGAADLGRVKLDVG